MKKLFFLFFTIFSLYSYAQFNSTQVYYYKFVRSEGHGVYIEDEFGKLHDMQSTIYVVFFSNNYMKCIRCSNMTSFQKELANNENYWSNLVRADYDKFAKRYSNPPTANDFAFTRYYPPQDWETLKLVSTVEAFKYNTSLSDSKLTTYTHGCANAETNGKSMLSMPKFWSEWHTKKINFSFSSNKNKMLIWDIEKPDDMLIYEMIDIDNFKFDMNNLRKHIE